jgi:hypothetical protein
MLFLPPTMDKMAADYSEMKLAERVRWVAGYFRCVDLEKKLPEGVWRYPLIPDDPYLLCRFFCKKQMSILKECLDEQHRSLKVPQPRVVPTGDWVSVASLSIHDGDMDVLMQ